MKVYVGFFFALILLVSRPLMADTQQLLQLIDYVGVDYSGAVADGLVVNEAEYAEMQDFAAGITQQMKDLPNDLPDRGDGESDINQLKLGLAEDAKNLAQWVEQKVPPKEIKTLTSQMHHKIIDAYQIKVVPR